MPTDTLDGVLAVAWSAIYADAVRVRSIDDPTERARVGCETFGRRWVWIVCGDAD